MSKHDDYWTDEVREIFRLLYTDPNSPAIVSPYEEMEPALKYGWNKGIDVAPDYPTLTWDEVAEELERGWLEKTKTGKTLKPWKEVADLVKDVWQKAIGDWRGLATKTRRKKTT